MARDRRDLVSKVTEIRPGVLQRVAHCTNCGNRTRMGKPFQEKEARRIIRYKARESDKEIQKAS